MTGKQQLPDSDALYASGLNEKQPYLGTPTVVRGIIAKLLQDALAVRTEQVKGSDQNHLHKMLMLADDFQSVFYGKNRYYTPAAFNSPEGLGATLVNECHIGGSADDAVARLGLYILKEFMRDVVAHEDGSITDEQMQSEVIRIMDLYTPILCGYGDMVDHKDSPVMAKSHINGYTKKDGQYVRPHNRGGNPAQKPAVNHHKKNEKGETVLIKRPHHPSAASTWHNPDSVATFIPDGDVPLSINGVRLSPWKDHPKTSEGWDYLDGVNDDLDEPPFEMKKGKHASSGVIIEEPDGRVWMIHPTNAYGGYEASFPKGTAEPELSLQANAIKEAFEESGLKVEITGFIGDFERTTSVCRMYKAKRVGGSPVDMGWETQAVSLVPKGHLYEHLNMWPDHPIAEAVGAGPAPKKPADSFNSLFGKHTAKGNNQEKT